MTVCLDQSLNLEAPGCVSKLGEFGAFGGGGGGWGKDEQLLTYGQRGLGGTEKVFLAALFIRANNQKQPKKFMERRTAK